MSGGAGMMTGPAVFRLTVLGTGTAAPEADTAASGILVESDETRIMFDCGTGVAARLQEALGQRALSAAVIGHQHADHWIDLAPLRYRFAWGERSAPRLPIYLPPDGSDRLVSLAYAIAERPTFFIDAYDIREYVSEQPFSLGPLTITPIPAQHYVPAWTMDIRGPGGRRIVYGGDMGPTERIVEIASGADLLLLEATLETSQFDDPRRGHLTTEEAIDIAIRSRARQTILVHYRTDRREVIARLCAESEANVVPALPLMQVELG